MSRINLILLIAVLASGIYMVRSAYDARRLFTELDRSQTEARRLEADYQRLLADRQAQATNLRVEQVARERLKMRPISPAITFTADASALAASAVRSTASSTTAPATGAAR
ncbi:cell division protein FtsL [Roseateles amylovorans]|uniref:Cell division protein FtsL n=1 Tax=Roseateles amylovorans TaxID=2978473 RepID=A0ABY6B1Z2_9BURK|nr:cell division protein FtsL [Roseateles amylovorans]UXH77315.1 cell division protein FtsL [Roseateles amylovorans]